MGTTQKNFCSLCCYNVCIYSQMLLSLQTLQCFACTVVETSVKWELATEWLNWLGCYFLSKNCAKSIPCVILNISYKITLFLHVLVVATTIIRRCSVYKLKHCIIKTICLIMHIQLNPLCIVYQHRTWWAQVCGTT